MISFAQMFANDPNVAPEFAMACLSTAELTDAIHTAAAKVSFFEAAEGSYSAEREGREAAYTKLRNLLREADKRGMREHVSQLLTDGGYLLVAPWRAVDRGTK